MKFRLDGSYCGHGIVVSYCTRIFSEVSSMIGSLSMDSFLSRLSAVSAFVYVSTACLPIWLSRCLPMCLCVCFYDACKPASPCRTVMAPRTRAWFLGWEKRPPLVTGVIHSACVFVPNWQTTWRGEPEQLVKGNVMFRPSKSSKTWNLAATPTWPTMRPV